MVKIQGMSRDVTPAWATALGGAGRAMRGGLETEAFLREQGQQSEENVRRREIHERQRGAFELSMESMREQLRQQRDQGERATVEFNQQQMALAGQRDVNEFAARAVQMEGGYERLPPNVQAFLDSSLARAKKMDPAAGRNVVGMAHTMVATAEQDVLRERVRDRVQNSQGLFAELVGQLQEGRGVDIPGDEGGMLTAESLVQLPQRWLEMLQDPRSDPAHVEQLYQEAKTAIETEVGVARRREKVYAASFAEQDSWENEELQAGKTLPDVESLNEIGGILNDFKLGLRGDGPEAERKMQIEIGALRRGNRVLWQGKNSVFGGSFVEVPASVWRNMSDASKLRAMGVIPEEVAEREKALKYGLDYARNQFGSKGTYSSEEFDAAVQFGQQLYMHGVRGGPAPKARTLPGGAGASSKPQATSRDWAKHPDQAGARSWISSQLRTKIEDADGKVTEEMVADIVTEILDNDLDIDIDTISEEDLNRIIDEALAR